MKQIGRLPMCLDGGLKNIRDPIFVVVFCVIERRQNKTTRNFCAPSFLEQVCSKMNFRSSSKLGTFAQPVEKGGHQTKPSALTLRSNGKPPFLYKPAHSRGCLSAGAVQRGGNTVRNEPMHMRADFSSDGTGEGGNLRFIRMYYYQPSLNHLRVSLNPPLLCPRQFRSLFSQLRRRPTLRLAVAPSLVWQFDNGAFYSYGTIVKRHDLYAIHLLVV